jgi:hypothetical protein
LNGSKLYSNELVKVGIYTSSRLWWLSCLALTFTLIFFVLEARLFLCQMCLPKNPHPHLQKIWK